MRTSPNREPLYDPILAQALPLSFSRAITWESPGNLLGMVPVVVAFIGIMVARSQPLLAAAYGLQFALVWIGWGYWNRDRPDMIADGVAASGLHSFPSGHAVVVIAVCWPISGVEPAAAGLNGCSLP